MKKPDEILDHDDEWTKLAEFQWRQRIEPKVDGYMGEAFEDACRTFAARAPDFPVEPLLRQTYGGFVSGAGRSPTRLAVAAGEVKYWTAEDLFW